ncbi:hypothetical protein B0I33_103168 [Prauserella shujinwangii]|uniref:Xaa-Pro dipeptidyl-peptidase-like domain-containing protein n=1 Tax=Prauserella shujinwangii TaxID=1453103 RepID=A0A2T0LYD7_9PSEU|nr:alpha/beta hydrolase [Prauserella shujinwangii]PRX49135.1 hypothetical protein B0I33_103168 [Prauserella shujinwangii]
MQTEPIPILVPGNGTVLAGRVYGQPADPAVRRPVVLVTGSWLTVKEQMAHVYAEALAERGCTAITFDFAGFGESEGAPRQAELPSRKIADIGSAARFAATLAVSGPSGVGYLGVCASAQYALAAIAAGAPITSFASVAGWFHDPATVAPFYGGIDGVRARLDRARDAVARYRASGEVVTVPAYAEGDERAAMFLSLDYYADPARGAVPEWTNAMAELSWWHWLGFDGLTAASRVGVPTLLVHGDDCVFPGNVESVRDRLTGPVETVWSRGGQTDFYDRPEQVERAADAAAEHFRRTLGAGDA